MLLRDSNLLEALLVWQCFNSYATPVMFMALCKCYIRTWRLEVARMVMNTGRLGRGLHPKGPWSSAASVQEEAALRFPLRTFSDGCVFQVDCCVRNRFTLH